MPQLLLVRHAQASFGSPDYDALSALGKEQAVWLGRYFAERGLRFDRVVTGTLRRHAQTLEAIERGCGELPPPETHPGLDEYDFAALQQAYTSAGGVAAAAVATDQRAFYRLLREALHAWAEGRLDAPLPESWAQFRARVRAALGHLRAGARRGERRLVISSGGPIAMLLGHVLELSPAHTIGLNMQLRNCSLTQVYFNGERASLAGFNGVPHLDRPDRLHALTYG